MFSEILKIKPQLDNAQAAKMEKDLSSRYARVAKKFGNGLKNAMKILSGGILLTLLSKLMNPLDELEEKVKSIVNLGKDLNERAMEFGTSAGELKKFQDALYVRGGITPDASAKMIESVRDLIEKARVEIRNTGNTQSAETDAVRNFALTNDTDYVKITKEILNSLGVARRGNGFTNFNVGGDKGVIELSGDDYSKEFEELIFGDRFRGSLERLIASGVVDSLNAVNTPVSRINEEATRLATVAETDRAMETKVSTDDFVKSAELISNRTVTSLWEKQAIELEGVRNDLKKIDSLIEAAKGIQEVLNSFRSLISTITSGIGEIVGFIRKLKDSPFFRNNFKSSK